jgi:hypothetical protein
MSSWVEKAEEFIGKHGFGSRGKHISISRVLNPTDLSQLQSHQHVCAYRPRGILSGFLVIHPELQYVVYLPPAASKLQPQRFYTRINPCILEYGLIASAYLYNKQVVIEDLLAIDGHILWSRAFSERWKRLKQFLENELRNDPFLQGGYSLTSTSYMPLGSLVEPSDDKVIEFVACGSGGQKRMIWIPMRDGTGATVSTGVPLATSGSGSEYGSGKSKHVAKQEAGMGPDVYTVYDGETKLGIALVRTLLASRGLRLAFAAGGQETIRVNTQFNKQFDKWEILDVAAAP